MVFFPFQRVSKVIGTGHLFLPPFPSQSVFGQQTGYFDVKRQYVSGVEDEFLYGQGDYIDADASAYMSNWPIYPAPWEELEFLMQIEIYDEFGGLVKSKALFFTVPPETTSNEMIRLYVSAIELAGKDDLFGTLKLKCYDYTTGLFRTIRSLTPFAWIRVNP